MAITHNFNLVRGDSYEMTFEVKDRNEVVINMTGYTVWMTAKNYISDVDLSAVFQKTLSSGITLTNATLGQVRVVLSPTDTSSLGDVTSYLHYDIQMKNGSGQIFTIIKGVITVTPDITRSTS